MLRPTSNLPLLPINSVRKTIKTVYSKWKKASRHHTSPQAEQHGFTDWLLNCLRLCGSYLRLMATDLKFCFQVLLFPSDSNLSNADLAFDLRGHSWSSDGWVQAFSQKVSRHCGDQQLWMSSPLLRFQWSNLSRDDTAIPCLMSVSFRLNPMYVVAKPGASPAPPPYKCR